MPAPLPAAAATAAVKTATRPLPGATTLPSPSSHFQSLASAQVVNVVDGDTIDVRMKGGVQSRYIGVDTPETVHPTIDEEP